MTDNEIIKALECCPKAKNYDDCKELQCPLYRECKIQHKSVEEVVAPYALDLINRLQAQIDEMFETLDYRAKKILELEDNLKTAKAENSKLEVKISEVEYDFSLLKQEREVVKAETYKEFAEKLLDAYEIWTDNDELEYQYVAELVDDLLKELVGEDK